VTRSLSAFRTLLHANRDRNGWEVVTVGESEANVFRSADRARYAKCVPPEGATSLEADRDRVDWLSKQGMPCARVLDWRAGADGAALVTTALSIGSGYGVWKYRY
jgi:streptomycin 3"-kinase